MMWLSRVKRRPLSLTTRVMVFVALAIGLSLLMTAHLVQQAVKRHFAEQDADELIVITQAVERALRAGAGDIPRLPEVLSHAVSGHHGVYFQVWSPDGQLIYGPSDDELLTPVTLYTPVSRILAANLHSWKAGGNAYRGAITQALISGQKYRIVAAIDMNFHIRFLDNFRRSLWLIMTLAGVVTLLAAWFGVHQGHAPLRGLSDTMRDVQADRLHVRIDPNIVPGELRGLVDSFNYMIGRLEDSFARLSHFSADIAHELRTPLTNSITQTQVALNRARNLEEYQELLYSNLEEQERLAKMVNDMLWLAQSEHGLRNPVREWLDLGHEVRELFDFFEALAEEKQIVLALDGSTPMLSGDRAMLRRAISNLLSNALRYTPAGQTINVKLKKTDDAWVELRVENPGLKIPPEHLPKIFDRFYRVDPSRQRLSEGAGLGLAIVKSIVEAHGGHIDAFSDDGITRFSIRLPLVTKDIDA